ncbi:MAG: AMP-binding protein [Acidimicrobiia bacterium]|nr:AMP-binding protein [Acidimicrobiia bacterium]
MNLVELFLNESKNTALVDGKDRYTYEKLTHQSKNMAGALLSANLVKENDHVVLIANNSAEFMISYLAILCIGAICIPMDPHATDAERARDIGLVKPNLIICASENYVSPKTSEKIPLIEFNSVRWREFLKHSPIEVVVKNDDDIAVMLMSSPPNSPPRPAMLTHGSLRSNLDQANKNELINVTSKDIVLAVLPMYHIFGLHVVAGLALKAGATLIIARTFDAIELSSLISHNKVTILPAVPALFDVFVNTRAVTIDSMIKVRLFISGGSILDSSTRTAFKNKFGADIGEGYGLTEASPMISFQMAPKCEGDIGQVLEGIEIDIRDSTGNKAPDNDVGQIVVRGTNIFKGYYSDSNSTAKVLDSNGWLFTGDIGMRDEEGSIILLERSSDVIVVDGFSVLPSEVEEVLNKSELVNASIVVGDNSDVTGECVIAYIELVSDSAKNRSIEMDVNKIREDRKSEIQIREFCKSQLARYKIPSKIIFTQNISATSRRKPLRKSLRGALMNLDYDSTL